MNKYGQIAYDHWRKFLPSRFQEIPEAERESFFSTLGQQVEDQVFDLAQALEGTDSPTEGYWGKVGRLNAATSQAEEKILAEMVYLETEIDEEDDGDLPDPFGQDLMQIQESFQQFWQEQDNRKR